MFGHSDQLISDLVTSLIPMILSLSLHEWGHAMAAVALGDNTPREQGRLTVNPVAHMDVFGTVLLPLLMVLSGLPPFGWAKPVQYSPRRFTRRIRMSTGIMITAFAGPAMNLVLALVAALVLAGTRHFGDDLSARWEILLVRIQLMNVMLFVFNLLPVPPLDGSRVLIGLLPIPLRAQYGRLERYSTLFLVALLVVGGNVIVGPSRTFADGLKHMAEIVFPY